MPEQQVQEQQPQPRKEVPKKAKIKLWMRVLMYFFPPLGIFYWFATLFTNKLGKIGLMRAVILGWLNLVWLFVVIIGSFMIIFCLDNQTICGIATKEATKAATQTTAK